MSCNNKEYLCIQWDSCESIRSQKDIERKEQRRTIQVGRDREREIERKRERERDSKSERMRNTTHTQSDRRTDRRMAPREGSQWARQRRGEGKRESERVVERRVVSREGRTECSSIPPVDRWQIYGSTRNADGGPRGKRTSYTYRRERTKRDRRISRKLFSLSLSLHPSRILRYSPILLAIASSFWFSIQLSFAIPSREAYLTRNVLVSSNRRLTGAFFSGYLYAPRAAPFAPTYANAQDIEAAVRNPSNPPLVICPSLLYIYYLCSFQTITPSLSILYFALIIPHLERTNHHRYTTCPILFRISLASLVLVRTLRFGKYLFLWKQSFL